MKTQVSYALLEEVVDALVSSRRQLTPADVPRLVNFLEAEGKGDEKYIQTTGLVTASQARWIDSLFQQNGNQLVQYETRKLPRETELPDDQIYLNSHGRQRWVPEKGLRHLQLNDGVYLTTSQLASLTEMTEEQVVEGIEELNGEHAPPPYEARVLVTPEIIEKIKAAAHEKESLEEVDHDLVLPPQQQVYYLYHPQERVEVSTITRTLLQPDIKKGVYLRKETLVELLGLDVQVTPVLQQRQTLSDGNHTYYYINGRMILAIYYAKPSAKQGDLEKTVVLEELGLLEETETKGTDNFTSAASTSPIPKIPIPPQKRERQYLGGKTKPGWLEVSAVADRLQEPFRVVSMYYCWDFDNKYQTMRDLASSLRKKRTFGDVKPEHLIAQRGILQAEGFDIFSTGTEYWLRWAQGDHYEIFAQIGFDADEQKTKIPEKKPPKKEKVIDRQELLEALRQRVFDGKHEPALEHLPALQPSVDPITEETEEADEIFEEHETYDESPPEDDTSLGNEQMPPSTATSQAIKELLRRTYGNQVEEIDWTSRRIPKK